MNGSNAPLVESLQVLERRLETPVVPGELATWVEEAAAAFEQVSLHLRAQIKDAHPKQFEEILRQDEGLAARVEQMQQQDACLLDQLTELQRIINELRGNIDAIEPDERLGADAHAAAIEKGLQLVIAARTQEEAISTWYVEAFERDRGVVD